MKTILLVVAALTGVPAGMDCTVTHANPAAIAVACEAPATGKWFVAVIDRATGTVQRATGRRS